MGHRQSRLVVCVGDTPVLIRVMGDGGAAWTSRIAASLGISQQTAEVHKCEHGVRTALREGSSLNAADTRSELGAMMFGALRLDLGGLVGETKRSFEYVMSCYPSAVVSGISLVGGGSLLKGLSEYLSRELGIAVESASSQVAEEGCRLHIADVRRIPLESISLAVGLSIGSGP